jgi:hypothetical protein
MPVLSIIGAPCQAWLAGVGATGKEPKSAHLITNADDTRTEMNGGLLDNPHRDQAAQDCKRAPRSTVAPGSSWAGQAVASSRAQGRAESSRKSPAEPVQQGEALLDDPAVHAQPGAMLRTAAGDHGRDALLPYLRAVLVVVIAAVGVELVRALAGSPRSAA